MSNYVSCKVFNGTNHDVYSGSSATPVQKIITSQKGISIDFDSLSRDTHSHSKELYLWGQAEADDIKDGNL